MQARTKGFDEVKWKLVTQPGCGEARVWTPDTLSFFLSRQDPPSDEAQVVKTGCQDLWPVWVGNGEWGTVRGGGLTQRPYLDVLEKEGVKSLCKEICK